MTISRTYTLTSLTYSTRPQLSQADPLAQDTSPKVLADFGGHGLTLTPEEASGLVVGQRYSFMLSGTSYVDYLAGQTATSFADSPNVQQSLREQGFKVDHDALRACTGASVFADKPVCKESRLERLGRLTLAHGGAAEKLHESYDALQRALEEHE